MEGEQNPGKERCGKGGNEGGGKGRR